MLRGSDVLCLPRSWWRNAALPEQSLLPYESRLLYPRTLQDMQFERGEFNLVKTQRFGTIRQYRIGVACQSSTGIKL